MSFDSVFHGPPTSNNGQAIPSGIASFGIDVTSGLLYYKTPSKSGWQTTAAVSTGAAGSDTQIQFNDGGSVGGALSLTWNKTTSVLGLTTQFAFNTLPVASLAAITQSNAGSGAVWSSIVLNSPSGSTANTLRKALNIYYQGALSNTANAEYMGLQVNAFALIDATTLSTSSLEGINVQCGLSANGVTVGTSAIGITCTMRGAAGLTRGVYQTFRSFNPQFTGGSLFDIFVGYNADHSAITSAMFSGVGSNYATCFSGNIGAGCWGFDILGPLGSRIGPAPLYHTTDSLGNGGTLLDGWFSGTGDPNNVVTANVGSFYSRRDGGASTSFYVKETGTGNTGWTAK